MSAPPSSVLQRGCQIEIHSRAPLVEGRAPCETVSQPVSMVIGGRRAPPGPASAAGSGCLATRGALWGAGPAAAGSRREERRRDDGERHPPPSVPILRHPPRRCLARPPPPSGDHRRRGCGGIHRGLGPRMAPRPGLGGGRAAGGGLGPGLRGWGAAAGPAGSCSPGMGGAGFAPRWDPAPTRCSSRGAGCGAPSPRIFTPGGGRPALKVF